MSGAATTMDLGLEALAADDGARGAAVGALAVGAAAVALAAVAKPLFPARFDFSTLPIITLRTKRANDEVFLHCRCRSGRARAALLRDESARSQDPPSICKPFIDAVRPTKNWADILSDPAERGVFIDWMLDHDPKVGQAMALAIADTPHIIISPDRMDDDTDVVTWRNLTNAQAKALTDSAGLRREVANDLVELAGLTPRMNYSGEPDDSLREVASRVQENVLIIGQHPKRKPSGRDYEYCVRGRRLPPPLP